MRWRPRAKEPMPRLLAFVVSVAFASTLLGAQRTPQLFALDRTRAEELTSDGKFGEAIALFESLLRESPKDGGLRFRLGYALYLQSLVSGKDGATERKLRRRARSELKLAEASRLDQPLIQQLLVYIKEDGSVTGHLYSRDLAANEAMMRGEAAFNRRDLATARAEYRKALERDGQLANAALFLGDTFFLEKEHREAQHWFERASQIDPSLEQAFRYWGDSLWQQGKLTEALEKYTEAWIAWPYNGLAWRTLSERAGGIHRLRPDPTPALPQATIKVAPNGRIELGIPEKPSILTTAYGATRAGWVVQHHPNRDKTFVYRQSLAEEVDALNAMLEIGEALQNGSLDAQKPETKVSEAEANSVRSLLAIRADGFLEAHILLTRANGDLAADYADYRDKHRDALRRYVRKYHVNLD